MRIPHSNPCIILYAVVSSDETFLKTIPIETGKEPIAQIMRRLLTGYAVTFNRRHRRYGRLFQNRYKSFFEKYTYARNFFAPSGFPRVFHKLAHILALPEVIEKFPFEPASSIKLEN